MPVFDRCKKCKGLVPEDELGKNGVCKDCMKHALVEEERRKSAEKEAKAKDKADKADAKEKEADEKAFAEAKEATEKAELEEKVADDKKTAAEVAGLVADGTFVITKGDVSKVCTTYTEAAEAVGCHPNSVSKAVRGKKKSVGDWSIEYPDSDKE